MSEPTPAKRPKVEMVKCPRCAAAVPPRPVCKNCSYGLNEHSEFQLNLDKRFEMLMWDGSGKEADELIKRQVLANVQFLCSPSDGSLPSMKPLRVTDASPVYFARFENSDLVRLKPGLHPPTDLFEGNAWGTRVQGSDRTDLSAFVCLNMKPVIVTLTLPDW